MKKDWLEHWKVERCLKLRPHFEHVCFIMVFDVKEPYPYVVRLAHALLVAEAHWAAIRNEGSEIAESLN